MRVDTVKDLIEQLEELDPNTPLMVVHQSQWPLREVIGGVWLDEFPQDCRWGNGDDCECDPDENPDECGCKDCLVCGGSSEESTTAYLVLNGHPYDGSPYGSKKAWNAI